MYKNGVKSLNEILNRIENIRNGNIILGKVGDIIRNIPEDRYSYIINRLEKEIEIVKIYNPDVRPALDPMVSSELKIYSALDNVEEYGYILNYPKCCIESFKGARFGIDNEHMNELKVIQNSILDIENNCFGDCNNNRIVNINNDNINDKNKNNKNNNKNNINNNYNDYNTKNKTKNKNNSNKIEITNKYYSLIMPSGYIPCSLLCDKGYNNHLIKIISYDEYMKIQDLEKEIFRELPHYHLAYREYYEKIHLW